MVEIYQQLTRRLIVGLRRTVKDFEQKEFLSAVSQLLQRPLANFEDAVDSFAKHVLQNLRPDNSDDEPCSDGGLNTD